MIGKGNKIGIVCCSNGQKKTQIEKINKLEDTLLSMGIHPVFSDYIYEKEGIFSGTAKERAQALMKFYMDDEIKGIAGRDRIYAGSRGQDIITGKLWGNRSSNRNIPASVTAAGGL